jgi:hypothetical protein
MRLWIANKVSGIFIGLVGYILTVLYACSCTRYRFVLPFAVLSYLLPFKLAFCVAYVLPFYPTFCRFILPFTDYLPFTVYTPYTHVV